MSEEQKDNCVNTFQDLQDLVPCELFLFPKLKVVVNVWRYNDMIPPQFKENNGMGSANFSILHNASDSDVHSCLMHRMKSQVGYFEVSSIDYDVSVVPEK